MTAYHRFNRLNLDTGALGIRRGGEEGVYFCTPKGASVIGWAGVDGIHFCTIRGLGEMVFAVSPMNAPGSYVHPLARDFSDFLRLLLACGSAAPLEQAYQWDQTQFDAFLSDNPITQEQASILRTISERMCLQPMEQPFESIKRLQADFDYGEIRFTEDYYDFLPQELPLPQWKVYFDGNFWGHAAGQRAGEEIPVQTRFALNDRAWYIPSVYACSKGLVVDICTEIPAARIGGFLEKWGLSLENDGSSFTHEQQVQMESENPMEVNFRPELTLNGKTISSAHGCNLSWNPFFPAENGRQSAGVCQRYGLDQASGWVVWRVAFPWQTKRRPKINQLSLTIRHDPVEIGGPRFRGAAPGREIVFTNPATGTTHTLTVLEYEQQEISLGGLDTDDYDFPPHCAAMRYTLSPDCADESFSIRDRSRGDRPRKKRREPMEPETVCDCFAVGIIGGADGPTVIVTGGAKRGRLRTVCSALCFAPVGDVEWEIVFHQKPCEDRTVKML